jgi:two-component system sensor histidine kinase KdpD
LDDRWLHDPAFTQCSRAPFGELPRDMDRVDRPSAKALLAELGYEPRLTIYLASAPGAGKTHRILSDAAFQMHAGRRVAIGWIETKGRPDLEELAAGIPRIPPRTFTVNGASFQDFDLEAAIATSYETIVLDELAHANPEGAPHAKRWQDALALRAAGKSVLGAFNVQHLETVAPVAERIIGHPIREIVPISLLRDADGVIALDVSVTVLESRLRSGRIVRIDDVERAAMGLFKPQNLQLLRELLLRTVDSLTVPVVSPAKTSTALAIIAGDRDPKPYVRRIGALAEALDLALEVTFIGRTPDAAVVDAVRSGDGVIIALPANLSKGDLTEVRAAFVSVPMGEMATKILGRPLDRDLYIVDPGRLPLTRGASGARHPYGQTAGDRLRIGYGRLTIYLGSIAGSGKTFAMLDRAHTLVEEGLDVVAALIETHGRVDTAAKAEGLEVLPRLPNGELDRDAVLRRRPGVVLIDELAHTNAPGSVYPKRYDDVINILRDGISVMTTLNVQHLEGLGDAVERLTGMHVRETLPDTILELADDVIYIDVTPDALRERLRQGKIYPPERIDAALSNFFRAENLSALRELTVRELMHARGERRSAPPFSRIVLGVAARERDVLLIERMARLAARLDIDLLVMHVALPGKEPAPAAIELLVKTTRGVKAKWRLEVNSDPAAALGAAAGELDVIVVESPRVKQRLFGPASFAVKVVRGGAHELLVLAPR